MEDIYDLLTIMVHALTRGGQLSEVIDREARALIEKADPKIEAKRVAAATAAVQAQADYAQFQQWLAFKDAAAQQGQSPAAPAVPAVQSPTPASGGPLPRVPVVPGA
jgi:hypothetical protein